MTSPTGIRRVEGRRERIFRRDAFRCMYCGEVFRTDQLTLDHVEPRVRGGDSSEGNLVTCCAECNEAKAGEPAWSYLARHDDVRERFLANAQHIWPRLRRAIVEAAAKKR